MYSKMKTIGLIGGTTWESTLEYYRAINQETLKRTGNKHTGRIVMYSLDFYDVESRVAAGMMDELGPFIGKLALTIETAGADCLLVCANTMHMFTREIKAEIKIPLIHIAEVTLAEVQKNGFTKVGLLATKPTMELDFYKKIFNEKGVEILIPDDDDRNYIHKTIFDELFLGILKEESRNKMISIMDKFVTMGAQGIILGCTEIPLLVKQENTSIPLFDTTYIHACAAVDFALS
jgi:aspartate racemase